MSKGIVVREGIIDIIKAKNYAKRNKIPFIDLRNCLSFASINQLNDNLSIFVSRAFKRPVRATLESFVNGECLGLGFVAIIPYNFVNEFLMTTKSYPQNVINSLISNESMIS